MDGVRAFQRCGVMDAVPKIAGALVIAR